MVWLIDSSAIESSLSAVGGLFGDSGGAGAGVAGFADFLNGGGQSFGCSFNFFYLGKCFREGMLVYSQIHIKI
ncbi:hypothetical protein TIFTF001_027325 [Ficus carica]|uniref:Uncharacterized protein n=1 Tax=Ficus carica TaxID=3494 RepID=A0AA88DN62_FICCA|nr:hypothetical protein TIFTF001_027325 [Ficus carica]